MVGWDLTQKSAVISCALFEHKRELEESSVPQREGAKRMTPRKSHACRKEKNVA